MALFKDIQKHGEAQESGLIETHMSDLTTAYFSDVPSDVSIKIFECLSAGLIRDSVRFVSKEWHQSKALWRSIFKLYKDTRRFSKAEMVTTLAGSSAGLKDGKGSDASFYNPWGLCANPYDQCLYICDYSNNSIRKSTVEGDVTTFVEKDQVKSPFDIAMNHKANCFYVVTNVAHIITKITSSGIVNAFAGSGQAGSSDGVGSSASFNDPRGIAIDQQTGNLFVSDRSNHLIRKITPQGEVSTLAGSQEGFADGNGKAATFSNPQGICFDENSQSLFVCDFGNNKLRQVQLNGEVTTLCDIRDPLCVAVTANQTVLVSTAANTLCRMTHEGSQKYKVEAVVGSGRAAREDGRPDECSFHIPAGIAVDEASHSCFIAEYRSHAIRRVSFIEVDNEDRSRSDLHQDFADVADPNTTLTEYCQRH